MKFEHLFAIQKVLNDRIVTEHQLQGADLFPQRVLALQIEVAELANETRCFKYWSKKPASPQPVILEEYVDALHFVLSLGLEFGFTDVDVMPVGDATDLTAQFLELSALTTRFAASRERSDYINLFAGLLHLGALLGFNMEETEQAYLAKNEENHRRQDTGY